MDIIIKPGEQEQFKSAIKHEIDKAAELEAELGTMPDVDPETGEYIIDEPDTTKPMTLRQLRSLAHSRGITGVQVEEKLTDETISFYFFRWNSKETHAGHFSLLHLPSEQEALASFNVCCQQVRDEK